MTTEAIIPIFPKSNRYDKEQVRKYSVGGNVLYSMEALTNSMIIKPGMRILDLGCGKCLSSIFLHKEYNVQVFAIDNFFTPNDNLDLIQLFEVGTSVFSLNINARQLPFPDNYFDCIISCNSYTYFGTDDKYLPYICHFLKKDGQIGITDLCFVNEIEDITKIPAFLKDHFFDYWYHIHSPSWWKNKWEKTGLIDIVCSKIIDESSTIKSEYIDYYPDATVDNFAWALKKDDKNFIDYFLLVGQRTSKRALLEIDF